jgi:hypothetical protein
MTTNRHRKLIHQPLQLSEEPVYNILKVTRLIHKGTVTRDEFETSLRQERSYANIKLMIQHSGQGSSLEIFGICEGLQGDDGEQMLLCGYTPPFG